MPQIPALFALLFIPLFALCDREIGDGEKGYASRSVAFAVAIVGGGVLGVLTCGPWFGLIGAFWAAWRSMGFAEGSLAPTNGKELARTALRYAALVPFSVLACWEGRGFLALAVPLAFAALATIALRAVYGQQVRKARAGGYRLKGDFNAIIERVGGGIFGAALAVYALLPALG